MELYKVEFDGVYPVGNCLVILAKDYKEAYEYAQNTISHTDVFRLIPVDMKRSGVVVYLSGDY